MKLERTPREVLAMIKRRRTHVIGIALVALLGAGITAILKPRTYVSSTRVRVEGVIDGRDEADKVHGVAEDIKNSANFDGVVTTLGLDAHLQGLPEHERNARRRDLVERLMAATSVVYSQPAPGVYVLTISHESADPDTCFRVANELSKEYRDQRLSDPIEKQQQVVDSRRESEERAAAELETISAELQEFDEENSTFIGDGLAEALKDVLGDIEEIEKIQIASLETDLRRTDEMLVEEPEMLTQVKEIRDEELISDIERDIRAMEKEVDRLRLEKGVTDRHPKMIAALATLNNLLQKLAEARADVRTEEIETPNEMHATLRVRRDEIESKLGVERRKLAIKRQHEAKLREDAKRAPEIRAERDRMVRDQRSAQLRHDELREGHKTERDKLQDLRNQRQLKFDVIDAPTRPTGPSGPGAAMIALMGLAVGIGAGVGLAYVLDAMDHSFRDVDDAAVFLGAPTLGAIHMIQTDADLAKDKRKRMIVAGLLLVLALAAGAAIAIALLGDPSEVAKVLRR